MTPTFEANKLEQISGFSKKIKGNRKEFMEKTQVASVFFLVY